MSREAEELHILPLTIGATSIFVMVTDLDKYEVASQADLELLAITIQSTTTAGNRTETYWFLFC